MTFFKGLFLSPSQKRKLLLERLTETALNAKDWGEMTLATNRLHHLLIDKENEQTVLFQLATTHRVSSIRHAAIRKLTEQTLLTRIALDDKDQTVGKIAVQRLTDQAVLTRIGTEHSDPLLREAAVRKLTDQTLLARIAAEDKVYTVRKIAVQTLTDHGLLKRIAMEYGDSSMRDAAVARGKELEEQEYVRRYGDALAAVLLSLPMHTEAELSAHVVRHCRQSFETFERASIVFRSRVVQDTLREYRNMTRGGGWRTPELAGNMLRSRASWGTHSYGCLDLLRLTDGEFAIVKTEGETD